MREHEKPFYEMVYSVLPKEFSNKDFGSIGYSVETRYNLFLAERWTKVRGAIQYLMKKGLVRIKKRYGRNLIFYEKVER